MKTKIFWNQYRLWIYSRVLIFGKRKLAIISSMNWISGYDICCQYICNYRSVLSKKRKKLLPDDVKSDSAASMTNVNCRKIILLIVLTIFRQDNFLVCTLIEIHPTFIPTPLKTWSVLLSSFHLDVAFNEEAFEKLVFTCLFVLTKEFSTKRDIKVALRWTYFT